MVMPMFDRTVSLLDLTGFALMIIPGFMGLYSFGEIGKLTNPSGGAPRD
jgi:hypothetical protein